MRATIVARAGMFFFFAVLAATAILAQTSVEEQRKELLAPPAKIDFLPWRQLDSDEFTRTYEVNFPSSDATEYPENNFVRLRVFVPADARGPVPSVVILHYWGATDIKLETEIARELNTLGVAGVVMTLPYHLSRSPKGHKSGELALQPDPQKLSAMMVQSVHDLRRTVDWIQSREEFDHESIGLAGTSLGGIIASLGYGIEPRFKCGGFVISGCNLAKILWTSSKVVAQRETLRRKGYTEERLREELVAIEPSEYLKSNDPRKSFVIAAKLDTVVPPACSQALITALGTKNVTSLDTGHYGGALARQKIVRIVAQFFSESLRGRDYHPPVSVKALTLKFGLVYSFERNLQVAISTDLWRSDPKGTLFGSAMLTSQGVQGFLGKKLGQGLSLGVLILPQKSGPAMVWNFAF